MKGALDLFDQVYDVIEREPWLQVSEIARYHGKTLPRILTAPLHQPAPKSLVDHVAERTPHAPRLRF